MNVTTTAIIIFSLAGVSSAATIVVGLLTARKAYQAERERLRALRQLAKR